MTIEEIDNTAHAPDWQSHPILTRADGGFVITKNAMPFHVPHEGEFAELWEQIQAFAEANPGSAVEESAPEPPTQEALAEQRVQAIHSTLDRLDRSSVRPMRAMLKGTHTEFDTEKLAEIEAQAEALRAELAEVESRTIAPSGSA